MAEGYCDFNHMLKTKLTIAESLKVHYTRFGDAGKQLIMYKSRGGAPRYKNPIPGTHSACDLKDKFV